MTSLRFASVFALSAVVSLSVACGSDEPAAPQPDPLATEADYCDALAVALCNAQVVGGCYLSDAASLEADTKKCVAALSASGTCNPDGLPYERDGAEACIALLAATFADAIISKGELSESQAEAAAVACAGVFSAGGAQGSACAEDVDCDFDGGLRCVERPGAKGTCQVPEGVGPAESCAAENQHCDEGFYCGQDDACVKEKEVGQDCSEFKPCIEDARCEQGACIAKKANGEDCGAADECTGGFCVAASGATKGVCGAQLVLAPTTGDSCDPFTD